MDVENIEYIYELSPMQQGMLFHSLQAPGSGVYVEQLSCALKGRLIVPALEQAWQRVVDRHSVLRTSFHWKELDKPVQLAQRKVKIAFEHQDWRGLSAAEQETGLDALLEADRVKGFDLTEAPLMRLVLIRIAEDSYEFVWSHHHLLLDGWSLSLLMDEVFAFYEAFARGQDMRLQPPRPHKEYIAWLQRQDMAKAEQYWRRTLKGFSAPTRLIAGAPVGHVVDEGRACAEQLHLSKEATASIQAFAREHQLTVNTILQGAWALLLSRYSRETDVIFGVTVSGRPTDLPDAEAMVGLFINTLPVRVQIRAEERLVNWLRELQSQQAEQRDYEYSPLAQVQAWSDAQRGTALFDTLVVFENYPFSGGLRSNRSGLEIGNVRSYEKTNYPLTLIIKPGDELIVEARFDGQMFDSQTIKRLASHLVNLLNAIATGHDCCLRAVPMMSEAERQKVLLDFNQPKKLYAGHALLHELFQQQANRSPHAIAVAYQQEHLSYSELNRRANQMAGYLGRQGAGPEDKVGICLQRGIEMVVAVLGILKAGGAYVPLDPAYPKQRLSYVIEDAKIQLLLTETKLQEALPEHDVETLLIDQQWEQISSQSDENVKSEASDKNLAYLIYTSGSTGKPKGVAIEHRNATAFIHWAREEFKAQDLAGVLASTSICFDLSVFEIFVPLSCGGKVIVAKNILALAEMKQRDDVSLINTVPSAMAELVRASVLPASVRVVNLAGETLPRKLVEEIYEQSDVAVVRNLYGPSEDTTYSTNEVVSRGAEVTIGRPIAGSQLYVLDDRMQPVPVGVAGEVCIAGAGLARGYLNRPDLTAERFVANPFSEEAGGRLYRTGDIARYRADGKIEYIGREDHQVKVRGYRIELGEIEAALYEHPDLREAAVIASEDSQGNRRLIAYVVMRSGQEATVSSLRAYLKEKLPDYMIPAAIIALDRLPLNANGKLERRALPAPEPANHDRGVEWMAPRNPIEDALAVVWAKVLGLEQVGIEENFFHLGGDSIRSIRIRAEALKAGLDVGIQDLFDHPTIRALARNIQVREPVRAPSTATAEFSLISEEDRRRLPDDVEDAYPLTRLQEGMLFHGSYSEDSAFYHDIFSFHIKARFDQQAFETVARELVARHPVLRTSFDLANFKEPLQMVHSTVDVSIQVEDIRGLSHAQQEDALTDWIEREKHAAFDQTRGPLLRFQIHRRSEDAFQFALSFHHAILDGWSLATLLTELFHLYCSALDEKAAHAGPPLHSSFKVFVALEREALESESARSFWIEKLADMTFAALPRYSASPGPLSAPQVGAMDAQIPPEVFDGLKKLSKTAAVPIKSILLGAHLRVISLLSGNIDVVTGVISNGRPETADGERALGLFLNTVPLRCKLRGGKWIDLSRQAFEAEKELLPFRRFPMAEMQRLLGGRPLFETAFNFTHFHVYESLESLTDIQLLGMKTFEQTNFILLSNFSIGTSLSEMRLSLEYNSDELSEQQVKAISAYYVRTLAAMAADADSRYERHALISIEEQNEVLFKWNNTQNERFPAQSICQSFERQVEQSPNAIAIVFEQEELTYSQLNSRANQLAHHLQRLGVGPGVLVGTCLERSLEAMIGLLGVLKAGGAYVPMDPNYPKERLMFMLEDAQPRVLLTQESLPGRLGKHNVETLRMDKNWDVIARENTQNPINETTGDDLAYVIYTSGSTGKPKGVAMTHRSLSNIIEWQLQSSKVGATRTLQFASLNFDVSFQEIFSTWLAGATLVLVSEQVRRDASQLWQLLVQEKVERIFLPFIALQQLAEVADSRELTNTALSEVITAGEQLRITARIARLFESLAICSLQNQYGPSESHVVTAHTLTGSPDTWPRLPPIGRPISNAQIYIFDPYLHLVPPGVPGELRIGGEALARGYYNRPELTAEKFLPNPLAMSPGARIYKTGDLARYLPDGTVEFLGRNDDQVKISGYRIEPGEIETVLSQHPNAQEAVVVAIGKAESDKRLVAYIVPDRESIPAAGDLRAFLKEKLPDYMIPSAFVMLEELPLTPSGKINLRALPAPDQSSIASNVEYLAPRTPLEEKLAIIWGEVLHLEQVGVNHNFFELGGHSLLATQVMSRVREACGIELPLRDLFEAPTISQLATIIEKSLENGIEQRINAASNNSEASLEGAPNKSSDKRAALLAERQALLEKLMELENQLQEEPAALNAPSDSTIGLKSDSAAGAMRATDTASDAKTRIMPRQSAGPIAPLSFAQQRLWFINQIEPNSPAYNIPTALRLRGRLNAAALERGINEIVRRHEALRTTFDIIGGEPAQLIAPALLLRLPVLELDHLPESDREAEATRLALEEMRSPFDLVKGPLIRARLARLGAEDHVLFVTMHHIVSDGWSMGVLVQEITALYEAYSNGKPAPLAPLPIQYADFAVWQRAWLQGEILKEQLGYWKQQLAGAPPVINLPVSRPRPPLQSFRGASELMIFPGELCERIKALCQREGATLFMTLLAAFQALVSRYAGTEDIVVGSPIANRNRRELEGLIGFFVNSLVMRTNLSGDPTFAELIGRVREVALGAYAHQDLPFEKIIEELRPERNLSHNPLFQVVFAVYNTPSETLEFSGLTCTSFETGMETEKFDLTMRMTEEGGVLAASLGYNTDLFDKATAVRILEHFQNLLTDAAANPNKRISALTLLSEAERQQLLSWAQGNWSEHARDVCLHQLFEAQVEHRANAIAMISDGKQLTYGDLNRRANQVAHYLRSMGIGPDAVVSICMERSAEMIIALLGILKAGGAYLPLDPDYPRHRLDLMLKDANPSVLLTWQNLIERLPKHQARFICIDSDWGAISQQDDSNPVNNLTAENLAYVIYTSGSTGVPKGVLITHANVVRLFKATDERFQFNHADVWSLFHSYAFDFSVWEIFGALTYGGRLIVVPYLVSRSPEAFYNLLKQEAVTVLNQTPSAFKQLMSAERWKSLREELAARVIIFGGEALEIGSLKPWFEREAGKATKVVNMYGITETTVHVTYREVSERDISEARGSVVGNAIADLQIYILDRNMCFAPIGIPGEIFVGGAGLARGYLNRPDRSAERFVPDPFSRKPGSRLYRSGDLARYLPTGDIEYLGRIDGQVKIRGFRIELGEIEAAILAHNGVGQAAVIVREDAPGDKRLAAYLVPAYLVPARQPAPGVDEMRSFLRDRLPEHMVPSVFMVLEKLPLTANGKLDRQALPTPGHDRSGLSTIYESPRNKLESMLAKLWCDVLGIEGVGINADFFALGGDSIKVAILINRLQQELDEIIHVVAIFKAPTIAQLAVYLKEHYGEAVSKVCGKQTPEKFEPNKGVSATEASSIGSAKVALIRELIPPLSPQRTDQRARTSKNPPAIFILSPPRSGSTLMRVMLGGHPLLFSPPELELLSFNSLEERRAAFSGADSFWLEGTIRAVMEIKNCDADQAKAFMRECEERKLDTKQFFKWMQDSLGERRVVDKTPSYALSKTILERIEEVFENPLYIHLLRHPHAMIQSFVEARLDQIFFRYEHPFSRRELAELIWIVSHQNILEFLNHIPRSRKHRVRYEDLVEHPQPIMQGLCEFLGLELQAEMLQPYSDQKKKMTDGLYAESRMLGDVKFHTYTKIDPAVAKRWKKLPTIDSLGEPAWQVAEALGYARELDADRSIQEAAASSSTGATGPSPIVELQSGAFNRPFFCVHSAEGGAVQFAPLAMRIGPNQPFYAIQGLNLAAPYIEIEERAARYNEALRKIQPEGPYLLGGWSYGGLVAFEMANQLCRNGQEVALLALLEPMAPIPGHEHTDYASIDTEDPVTLLEHIRELAGGQLELRLNYLRQLAGDELLNHILQHAKKTPILPPEIDAGDLVPWLRGYRAKLQSARNYVAAVYPGRITLFTTKRTSLESKAAGGDSNGDDSVAVWRGLSSHPVEIHMVSGTHHTMIQEPNAQALAGLLRECIRRATDYSSTRQREEGYSQARPNEFNTSC